MAEINPNDLGLPQGKPTNGNPVEESQNRPAENTPTPDDTQQPQESEVPENSSNEPKNDNGDPYAVIAQILKQEGIVDIPDDTQVTQENFNEVVKGYIEQSKQSAVEQLISALPQEVQYLVQYSLQGGNPKDVLPLLMQKENTVPEVNESNAEIVVRNYMQQKGIDNDVIELTLKSLKDSGKLVDTAKKYNEEYKKQLEEQEKQRLIEIEQQKKQQEEQIKQFIETTVSSAKEIGLPENEVYQFITVPVETVDNQPVTQFELKMQKLYSDPNIFAKLVYWAMNDFSDDIFVKKAKAQVTKDVMKKLNNIVKSPKQSQATNDNRPIWEIFNG